MYIYCEILYIYIYYEILYPPIQTFLIKMHVPQEAAAALAREVDLQPELSQRCAAEHGDNTFAPAAGICMAVYAEHLEFDCHSNG